MARVGLSDVVALPDPLLTYQFEWYIPSIPGGGDGSGLKTRCRTASIPGETKEEVEVTLHGVTLKYAGRTTYTHEITLEFQETRDVYVMTRLRNWLAYSRNILNTTGSYKSQYAATSFLYLYDDTQTVVSTIKLYNSFIKSLQDVNLDGTQSQPLQVSGILSYDYVQQFAGQA